MRNLNPKLKKQMEIGELGLLEISEEIKKEAEKQKALITLKTE